MRLSVGELSTNDFGSGDSSLILTCLPTFFSIWSFTYCGYSFLATFRPSFFCFGFSSEDSFGTGLRGYGFGLMSILILASSLQAPVCGSVATTMISCFPASRDSSTNSILSLIDYSRGLESLYNGLSSCFNSRSATG